MSKKYDYDVANELADKYLEEHKMDIESVKVSGFLRALGEFTIRDEFKDITSYKRLLMKLVRIFDAIKNDESGDLNTFDWFDQIIDNIPESQFSDFRDFTYDYIKTQVYQCFNSFTAGWGSYKDYMEAMEEKYNKDREDFMKNTFPNFNYDPDIIN